MGGYLRFIEGSNERRSLRTTFGGSTESSEVIFNVAAHLRKNQRLTTLRDTDHCTGNTPRLDNET